MPLRRLAKIWQKSMSQKSSKKQPTDILFNLYVDIFLREFATTKLSDKYTEEHGAFIAILLTVVMLLVPIVLGIGSSKSLQSDYYFYQKHQTKAINITLTLNYIKIDSREYRLM